MTDVVVSGAGSPQTPLKMAPKIIKLVEYRPIMNLNGSNEGKGKHNTVNIYFTEERANALV